MLKPIQNGGDSIAILVFLVEEDAVVNMIPLSLLRRRDE
jgi:hypothetical protein